MAARTKTQPSKTRPRSNDTLHLVGGGCRHDLLNHFTANALQRPVVTGPVEATAIGNLICQGMAVGAVCDLAEARALVRAAGDTRTYTPTDAPAWEAAFRRYLSLTG